MRVLLAAVAAATMVAGCASNRDEDVAMAAPADPMSPLSAPGYMMHAASSDMFEIESSRLALQMSRNPAVRSFAQTMIDHHTRTTAELTGLAQQQGMTPPPPQMLPPQMAAMDRLRAAPAMEFDAAYKREQIAGHQEALMLHRNYASSGDLPPFQAFASRTVPIIEMHLNQAQSLPDQMMMEPAPAAPARAGERG